MLISQLSKATADAMSRTPAEWDQWVGAMSDDEKLLVAKELAGLVQTGVMLRAYIDQRQLHYGHDAAVKVANSQLASVRKAMGYSYPEAGQFNF